MKMKYLKFKSVFAIGVMALTVLASCSDGNDNPELHLLKT